MPGPADWGATPVDDQQKPQQGPQGPPQPSGPSQWGATPVDDSTPTQVPGLTPQGNATGATQQSVFPPSLTNSIIPKPALGTPNQFGGTPLASVKDLILGRMDAMAGAPPAPVGDNNPLTAVKQQTYTRFGNRVKTPAEIEADAHQKAQADYEAGTIEIPTPPEFKKTIGTDTMRISKQALANLTPAILEKLFAAENPKAAAEIKPNEVAARAMVEEDPTVLAHLPKPYDPTKPIFDQMTGKQQEAASKRATSNNAENKLTEEGKKHQDLQDNAIIASIAHSNALTSALLAQNDPAGLRQTVEDIRDGKMARPTGAAGQRLETFIASHPDIKPLAAPLSSAAQKALADVEPVQEQLERIKKALEPMKNDNTAGKFAGEAALYKIGIAPDDAKLLANMNMSGIVGAARVLKGGSRAFQALQLAMEHTTGDAWHKSPKLLYDQATNILDNLHEITDSARANGNKYGMYSAPADKPAAQTVTKAQVQDYANKHKLSYDAAKAHVASNGYTVAE